LIVLSVMPQLTIFKPSGENWTQEMEPNRPEACAFVFSLNSPSAPARQARKRQFWPRRGNVEGYGAPESQALIVPSRDPDTIVVPSGENATDMTQWLWAFVFSLSISSLPDRQANKR